MTTKHSLISPSNFERRMLCSGSLNAEKDLPEVLSKYSEEGKLLHEITAKLVLERTDNSITIVSTITDLNCRNLTDEQLFAVTTAANYYWLLEIMEHRDCHLTYQQHELALDLSFIYPDMKGTCDSILILKDTESKRAKIHVIDYKFGKGIEVSAYQNYQLILYYLGAINHPDIKYFIADCEIDICLHIVQPFRRNSRWDLTKEEISKIHNLDFYKDVVNACYAPNAKRIASKKACQFCKAKPRCPALAKTVPQLDVDVFELEDEEIAAIYDNRELTNLYLSSIEEYIKNKISDGGFAGYSLVDKLSNRKWNNAAINELPKILGEDAFETTTKLIGISKAEKILGKTSDAMSNLTMKEVTGVEIVKITTNQK